MKKFSFYIFCLTLFTAFFCSFSSSAVTRDSIYVCDGTGYKLTPSTGSASYTFHWYDAAWNPITTGVNGTTGEFTLSVNNLASSNTAGATVYHLAVDSMGAATCGSDTNTYVIYTLPKLTALITGDSNFCATNSMTLTLNAQLNGGTNPNLGAAPGSALAFAWTLNPGGSQTTQSVSYTSPSTAGTYAQTVTVRYTLPGSATLAGSTAAQCTSTANRNIRVLPKPTTPSVTITPL